MKVWLLKYYVMYESDDVLGVYSSLKECRAAARKLGNHEAINADGEDMTYYYQTFTLDAPPE
ncbi:MAG: hypothetical protein ACXAB7_23155 [Candidatus Kariarchaeaceae archaeon]|jgi:hypothetical protein